MRKLVFAVALAATIPFVGHANAQGPKKPVQVAAPVVPSASSAHIAFFAERIYTGRKIAGPNGNWVVFYPSASDVSIGRWGNWRGQSGPYHTKNGVTVRQAEKNGRLGTPTCLRFWPSGASTVGHTDISCR